ncbi:DivIVA domain-containing protein [Mycetocola tolaasinivorans]|uniref:DivIVA domain-containing protein n=1 Tax=Mycetocola tolaasinivorans TaxID=76635 RepID=UPI0016015369|nr:DivIVA domain-containing protein [Mycetocola tolaasinivorans]
MSTTFPDNKRGVRGYRPADVDAFLERARIAYDAAPGSPEALSSADIRSTSFKLVKKGYSTGHVDAALERLEDAFALRERELALSASGQDAWLTRVRETAQVLLNRLARPEGERFRRAGRLTQGYSVADVDAFAAELRGYFQDGLPLSLDRVRTVTFSAERGGYAEEQVDLVLDEVTNVMLAVR